MPLENLINEPLIVVLSNVPIDLAHHLTELRLGNPLIVIHIRLKRLENIIFEIGSDDRWVLKRVENGADQVRDNGDIDGLCLSVLESENSEDLA